MLALRWAPLLLLAACNQIFGFGDPAVRAASDAAIADSGPGNVCNVYSQFGLLTAVEGVTGAFANRSPGGEVLFAMRLDVASESDLFLLSLYPGMGALAAGGLQTKTYTITAEDAILGTCGICAVIGVDVHLSSGAFEAREYYIANAGDVEFFEVGPRFRAQLRNLSLRHVIISAGNTTEASDGCKSHIDQIDINMPLPGFEGGVPDAGVPDAGVLVTGTVVDQYVTATGDVARPNDLRSTAIEALVEDGPSYVAFPGSGDVSGNLSIPGVPPGKRMIRIGDVYHVTSALQVSYGQGLSGRPDRRQHPSETSFTVNVSNAEMVEAFDSFEVFIPNINLAGELAEDLGATAFTSGVFPAYAVEDAAGDRVFITQLALRTNPSSQTWRSLSRYAALPPFSTIDGQTVATNPLAFITVPENKSMTLDWKRTQFQAARTLVNPQAAYDRDELSIVTFPGRPKVDLRNASVPALFKAVLDTTSDTNYGMVTWGDPFDASWERWTDHKTTFTVAYTAPGATEATKVSALMFRSSPFVPTLTVVPVVSPVLTPTIEGLGAFQPNLGVGLTPLLAWTAPTLGTPHGYAIYVYELTKSGVETRFEQRAVIFTTDLSVRLPPGVMDEGRTYFARIRALIVPNANLAVNPLAHGMPDSGADVLTATFTP